MIDILLRFTRGFTIALFSIVAMISLVIACLAIAKLVALPHAVPLLAAIIGASVVGGVIRVVVNHD
jgi:hypothetical protein